jgi:hypothetical protein
VILLERWVFNERPPLYAVYPYLNAMGVYPFEMVLAGISFIRYPVVIREAVVQFRHYAVSVNLCDYARRRYAQALGVALIYKNLSRLDIEMEVADLVYHKEVWNNALAASH